MKLKEDIDIKFSALRLGEKLYKELFFDQKINIKTKLPNIFMAGEHLIP